MNAVAFMALKPVRESVLSYVIDASRRLRIRNSIHSEALRSSIAAAYTKGVVACDRIELQGIGRTLHEQLHGGTDIDIIMGVLNDAYDRGAEDREKHGGAE